MTTRPAAAQLADAITDWWQRHDLFDPSCVFTNPAIFIEAYAIRGALARVGWLDAQGHRTTTAAAEPDRRDAPSRADGLAADALVRRDVTTADEGVWLLAGAFAFCERVASHQGVQGPPEALMMGYGAVEIPKFADCAPEVILYSAEGIVEGLSYLRDAAGNAAAAAHPAAGQFRSMAQWLVAHVSPEGRWPEPPERGYRDYSAGLPWLLLRMDALLGPEPAWRACAEGVLAALATPAGAGYYGLYVRPFTGGLAWLSAVTAELLGCP